MSGVSALGGMRGSLTAAPFSTDPIGRNAGRFEVSEVEVVDTVWALHSQWYGQSLLPRMGDWLLRRLDCFAADYDDPRIAAILDRLRAERCFEDPFRIPEVVDAATGESGIVEVILEAEREWRMFEIREHSNDLLVDVIRMERNRW